MRKRNAVWIVLLLANLGYAQTSPQSSPTEQQIKEDLAGQYAATQAQPVLEHRSDISRRIEKLLVQQARYLISILHPWDQDKTALLLTAGGSKEGDIRPNTTTANGLAMLYRAGEDGSFVPELPREMARDKAIAILRFVLPTHGAGGLKTKDGKQWKDQWQSAHWAYAGGCSAWLLWDSLDPKLRWLAARMICDEADRFIDQDPPHDTQHDTKAEENAWNAQVISLAYNMFPNHPRHAKYREAAFRWTLNAYCVSKDITSDQVVDGKPLKEWLKGLGPNLYDDYTLENHDRVHPDYMCAAEMNMCQQLVWQWGIPASGEKAIPEMCMFNIDHIYQSLERLVFPDGGWIYPNAQDSHLHRLGDWLNLHVEKAVSSNDPMASRLMELSLETTEKMAARSAPAGPIQLLHETRFASSQSMLLEWTARGYLLLLQKGVAAPPIDQAAVWKQLAGKYLFSFGKFAVLRTEKSISTFSWGAQKMGMVLPLQQDLLLTPNERSMIGVIDEDLPVARDVQVIDIPDTLAVAGILDRGKFDDSDPRNPPPSRPAPKLEQRFAYVALPDGRTVYVDALKLVSDLKPTTVDMGTLGVLNDKDWVYHNGVRKLYYADGEQTFKAADAAKEAVFRTSSKWINIDNGLGVVLLKNTGQQIYNPKPTRAPGRLEQLLHLGALSKADIDQAKAGDIMARHVFVFYPGQKSGATKTTADQCKLSGDDLHPVVTLEDGTTLTIDLSQSSVAVSK